jgi:CubicO group peptidase (beta-lactamase class C family)
MGGRIRAALLALLFFGCGDDATPPPPDGGSPADAAGADATRDGAGLDGGAPPVDAGSADAGVPPDDISALLESLLRGSESPALAAAATDGERLLALGAAGVRRLGDPTPVTAGDRFHLGSCTKAMTATLIAILAEEGLVTWETTIAEAFPELAAAMRPEHRDVTLDLLTSHRGGFMEQVPGDVWPGVLAMPSVTAQRRAIVEAMTTRAQPFPPDTMYLYSNVGFIIAGAMLEAITGTAWEALLTDRVFEPLGMGSCGFGAPGTPGALDEPWGHDSSGGTIEPVPNGSMGDNPAALGPAGTVHCSLADWAAFARAHATSDPILLTAESYERMHTPWPGQDYRAGWGIVDRSWAGGLALAHSGSNTLWYAVVWIAPEVDRAYLVATNVATAETAAFLDGIVGELLMRYPP